jgi:hypothetical protein
VRFSGSHSDKYEDHYLLGWLRFVVSEIDRHFRGAYCLHHQGDDDGGSKHL